MPTPIAISIQNLGKMYRIGAHQQRPQNLREALQRMALTPFSYLSSRLHSATEAETLWALRNVSFDVQCGETVGIIGRNGAGKSTLLKILSRITDPSEGRATLRGRVNSLLEVGTGFHPELTGRENIFLSASIFGMRKAEITRKFDEIVAFAEIDKFIDTPVKRYSSGMYVRLAFGVAANLEPDILIIDEVLAVGDAEFQNKCLGKMQDVAKQGRTVLFVSHQMAAVTRLCQRAILIEGGRVTLDGPADVVSSRYLAGNSSQMGERRWDPAAAPGDADAKLLALRIKQQDKSLDSVDIRLPVVLEMDFLNRKPQANLICCLSLFNEQGTMLFPAVDLDNPTSKYAVGTHTARFTIPGNLFAEGVIRICAEVSTRAPVYQIHFLEHDAAAFQVIDTGEPGSVRAGWGRAIPGALRPKIPWAIEPIA